MYVRLLTNNFLSEKAVGKSESKDVHLAVLRVLPEVIRESVDADASSKSVIVYDPASGEKKMVSPTAVDGIESLGEVKTAEQREAEINARMQDTIQRGKDWLEGNVANPVGMQIQLGDGRIATIEAMHEDGKSAIATLPDGTQFLVSKDVLQRIVNNGQYADYKARRDAEASKRETEQGTESAPETATEGGQPLPEESSPKEEESREYAQGDVFDVVVDGQKMHAEIVSPKDADGRFVVNVDDGESMRTLYVTPEELAAMEYREEPLTKAEETRLATEGSSEKALERGEQPTEEHTPTALERIPRDEKGNAQFHDVDTETAWDGLVEMSGNEETAHKVAEASLANAEKKLKAAKALKEKGDTPEELLQSIKENEAAVAEAQRVVDAWKAIVGEEARREEDAKAEAERIATEKAEAERKAAEERERAEAEEEARVEAERKAEEERIAKQKAEEKTEEAESDKEEAEKQMDDEEPKPLGSGVFGNIYNQFKGKVKEAFDFLMKHKGGDLLGVFHRKDVGDIDLVWGDHGGGLAHIIRRHIIEQNDFKNVDEIQKVIEDVIRNGLIVRENKDKINIEYNGYRVSIKKTIRDSKGSVVENKNWIVTAFDKSKPKHEKRNPSSSETLTTPSANQKADGVTLPSNEDSIGKGSKKAEKKQKKQSVFDKAKEIADKEEKKRKAETEDDSALGQATRAVGKKKKVNRFKYTASKIISYPALRGVHYANGYAYASDGYILFKEKADYPKEWEGTTRDKDGNLIDGKYPDTEKAIHRLVHIPDKEVESLPSKEVLDFAIAASKKLKGEAIPVAIDGLFFNAVNLKKFLEAVASKGMDKVVYRHPMLYATNGKDEIVMMPTVNTLEGALDIADRMESAGLPKEQIDAWKAHIEAADKKMSLEDFKKAVENAKKEGVRHTEAEKPKEQPLTEAERKDAEDVAGALGYRVEWVDTMEENGTIDADKKVIRIAKDAENPLVQVLGHEVAHGVKRMVGGKFKALQKAAMEVVGEKEWNERIEKKRKLNAYAEGKLAEEVTCDIVGEALNDKDALKRLAESLRGEKGILARLRDAVAKMVEYFKNRGDKEGVRRMKAADRLLAEFESALKEGVAPEQVKPEGVDRSVREGKKDDKTLYGIHNISEDKLRKAMKLGGLANPSMAVVDKDKGTHEGFGAISLIAPSSLVDKQTGRTAGSWITDAYTQRYPFVERVMSDKGYKKFKSWVDGLDFAEKEKKEIKRQATDAMGNDKDLAWELMYLREKGVDVKGYTSEVDYPWEKIIEEYPSVEDIIKAMDHNAELKETVTKLAKVEITVPIYKAVSADVRRRFKEETGENASPLNPIIRKRTHDIYNRDYAPKLLDENGMPKASDVRKVIGQMVEKYNATKKVDFNKSKSKASTYVHDNGLYADYLKWQEGKLEEFGTQGRIFRGYKNDGTRKYVPETLSNVSKAMKEESQGQTNGSEYTSFGSFIAKLAPRVDSKEEMRGSKSRLDADEAKQEFYEKWESTYYDLATELHSDVFSGEARLHDIVLQSDPKRYAKKEYGITLSPSFLKRLEALKKAIREDLKSAYFETKFERPVMLNEFAAAVVPKGIGDDVRKGLEDAGLVLYEYDPAKKGDRERAANEASASDGIRFNRSEKTELTAEERELRDNLVERMRKGGLDVVTDSEEMQRVIDTENERTRMMGAGSVREHRVYHGSGADFDAFDHSHMGEGEGAQAYGWGTYVTEVEGIGRTYAIQNTTKHNDALRALQHDVDAISDQLNRHRDDLKYDEEQLKRANEWRAEAELDY